MQLVFSNVSYSYVTKNQAQDAKRKRRSAEDAASANWGNDPDQMWALRGANFTLHEGEFLGICGHTGSGKSTLIQHMNGLLHPTRGAVLLDGHNLADKGSREHCRQVGVVFQYPEHQLFCATVWDDVAFGPRNLGLSPDEVDSRVREALQQVGLGADDFDPQVSPFELSGGQQRRVAFAGVLAMRPKILVLDEPAAGLDPATRANFLGLIKDLHRSGLTVVMVSHSMDDLARLCDRLLVLNKGRTIFNGTPTEVFSHPKELKKIGLDVPAAQKMAAALRQQGFQLPRPLYATAAELAEDIAALYRQRSAIASSDDASGSATASSDNASCSAAGSCDNGSSDSVTASGDNGSSGANPDHNVSSRENADAPTSDSSRLEAHGEVR